MNLKIAAFQLNATLGDLPGNTDKIIAAARSAHERGVRLLLTPELSVCGSPALDLLTQPDFVAACEATVQHIAAETSDLTDLTIVLGYPARQASAVVGDVRVWDALSVIRAGRVIAFASRQHFDTSQQRWFVAGPPSCAFDLDGVRVVLLPGADCGASASLAATAGADLLLVVDAVPFFVGQAGQRQKALARAAQHHAAPLVYVNLLGGQDGVVFDGAALALDGSGAVVGRASRWRERIFEVAFAPGSRLQAEQVAVAVPDADLWQALVLGLRDYMIKNGFAQAALGLSGGLDSALVLALAVDALGADNVRVLLMPSPYTADISIADAREMAQRVGVRLDEIDITPLLQQFKTSLAPLFADRAEDVTEENLQARIRGMLLMALSNKFGHVVLATSNKSEVAVGYSTLYGDMCGGYAPIKDVFKSDVFRLARWRNAHDPFACATNPIPQRIITRPPSAELRAGQVDADSLPPYDVLDAIIAGHVERGESVAELVARGLDAATVARVTRLIRISQFKRRQSAPGTRVSRCDFDDGWRYPMTHKYRV